MKRGRIAALLGAVLLTCAGPASAADSAASGPGPEAGAGASAAGRTVLTAEQREAIRARVAELLNRNSDELTTLLRADGAGMVDLQGHFQHAMIVRRGPDGRPQMACFDDPDAATAFLAFDDLAARSSSPDESDSGSPGGVR